MIMAQLKQLSAGSSQIIMMMFRDKNNAPIKADSVHVKGSIFTGSGKPFEFEVNKGVCTNCKIQNDMLLFNIVPLLGLGQMQVYTQTFLGDAKAITGTYISENQQKLGVEVVQKGTFLSDRQGAMWVDVYLPIEINDAAQIPWVPAGADEQWIKDYLDKYVKTPAFAATLAALGGASKNLSNVDAKDFEKKAKDGNFAQNDLADVDLAKLKEKGLEYQKDYAKFVVMTPAGDASYRYTYNKIAGNIPLGIKKGLALVSNNNAWADPGASDPNKVQGDLLAEADGIITIQYSGQAYNETSTMNEANFWAVKVAPDGSLTEVPNSRYSTTIEANRKIAKNIQSKSISFPIQQGESVRFLANSNIDDGFYLQSGTDGKPLFEVIVNFKEMVGMPFIPDELEKGATEFYE
jgi:hypothetical protein